MAEDGTVQAIEDVAAKMVYENGSGMASVGQQDFFMTAQQQQPDQQQLHQEAVQQQQKESIASSMVQPEEKVPEYSDAEFVSRLNLF